MLLTKPRSRMRPILILLCLAATISGLSLAPPPARAMTSEHAAASAAGAAVTYANVSAESLEHMLAAMRSYSQDQEDMQKALGLMQAVKAFEATTLASYEEVHAVVSSSPALNAAVEAFRTDQSSLARRLMNSEPDAWGPMLAETRRLEQAVREAAKSPSVEVAMLRGPGVLHEVC